MGNLKANLKNSSLSTATRYALIIAIFLTFFASLLYAESDDQSHSIPKTNESSNNRLSAQQQNFLEKYQLIKDGKTTDTTNFKDYVLYPYLEFERIRKNIHQTSDKTLETFIRENGNTYMAETLWTIWLGRKITRKKWQDVVDYYKHDSGGISAKCYYLEASIQLALQTDGSSLNQSDADKSQLNQNLNTAKDLWLAGKSRPSACDNLFELLKQKGRINSDTYWQRISLAMEKGNTKLANSLAQHLDEDLQQKVSLWIKLRKDPEKYLKQDILDGFKVKDDLNPSDKATIKTQNRQLIVYGIQRLARKKEALAKEMWADLQKKYAFTPKEKAEVLSYFGIREALNHSPYALRKLSAISSRYRTEQANIWMARMAVRMGDWKKYLLAFEAMSDDEKSRDIWRYWQAHALSKNRDKTTSRKIFETLAKDASFYGFLSADRLKLPYQRLERKPVDWQKCTPKIAQLDSIKRARELFTIGKPALAKKEWFWTLDHLNKQGILAASAYAQEIEQPFLSILTVSKTRDWNQVDLRFPLKYESLVKYSAKQHRILPAWVYGIMRRESAFDSKIVSVAKAQGLMQILPSTAKAVARKLGIDNHQKSDLLIPEKNAHLGSAYLSNLLKKFKGNYVKATAAYNAGPGRVVKWTPDLNIDAPRWVESIPFTETRKYVRAVMSYTTIYDHKLNHKQGTNVRLSKRLKPVGPG